MLVLLKRTQNPAIFMTIIIKDVRTPTELIEGESIILEIEIENIGEEEARNFNITAEAIGAIIVEGEVRYVTIEIGSYDVVELSANAIGIYEIEWEPEIAGTFNLKTVVDPKGQVLEENKLNNELTIPVEVQEKPRPILYYEIVAIAIIIIITLLYFFREQITGFFRTI